MSLVSRASLLKVIASVDTQAEKLVAAALHFEQTGQSGENTVDSVTLASGNDDGELLQVVHESKFGAKLWALESIINYANDRVEPIHRTISVHPSVDTLPPPLESTTSFSAGQLQNAWDTLLRHPRSGIQIDVKKAVRALATQNISHGLPRRSRWQLRQRVVLLEDQAPHLTPVRVDIEHVRQSLIQLLGNEQTDSYCSVDGPFGEWLDGDNIPLQWDSLAPPALVVVVSDFGAVGKRQIDKAWGEFLHLIQSRGVNFQLLSICAIKSSSLGPYCLDRVATNESCVENLLAALSQALWAEPEQLRRLRVAVGASLADMLTVFQHRDVMRQGDCVTLKSDSLIRRLKQFSQMPDELRARVDAVVKDWQLSLPESWHEAEALQRRALQKPDPQAFERLHRLAVTAKGDIAQGEESVAVAAMLSMLPMVDAITPNLEYEQWGELLQAFQTVAARYGRKLPLGAVFEEPATRSYSLRQKGNTLELADSSSPSTLLAVSDLAMCLETRTLLVDSSIPDGGEINIIDRGRQYQLMRRERPAWADRFWRDSDGAIHAAHPHGVEFQLRYTEGKNTKAVWRPVNMAQYWPWASETGVDDYGLWADLTIGDETLRMRWIQPGKFMMGDTGQHHQVTLSQGYWLAETTCTRAIWLAGETIGLISAITDKFSAQRQRELPKGDISWDDCRQWIDALNEKVPGFNARFPTEAEWEYACRAGTTSPYWWGDEFDEKFANSSMPSAEALYPANPWGLKSMSGNMGEWCSDWYGKYPNEAVTDPSGPPDGQWRVLRGGNWIFVPHDLRSANRDRSVPDNRDRSIGFRLAGGGAPRNQPEWAATADRAQRSSAPVGRRGPRREATLGDRR